MEPLESEMASWYDEVMSFISEDIGIRYCREKYDEREYPHEIYDGVVEREWLGLTLPVEVGGSGRTHLEQVLLLEALGKYGYDFGIPVLVAVTSAQNIIRWGSEAQINEFIPPFLSGDIRFSVGVTEPNSGSDAASLETQAEQKDERYVISGEKTYQSGAGVEGNYVNCYVRTDDDVPKREGISSVLIPISAEGVTVSELPLVARKAAGTYHLAFDNVTVPVANRIGSAGEGWEILTDHLLREHTYMAAVMVGNAATVIESSIEETTDRERFGRSVSDFQAVSHRIAQMDAAVRSAQLLVRHTAKKIDAGVATRLDAARAKLNAGEVLKDVSQTGVQLLGGAGLHPENDMGRYWREGASATIAGGTSEIQRSIIAQELLQESE